MLMVKPGMTCLDIARQIKDKVCYLACVLADRTATQYDWLLA